LQAAIATHTPVQPLLIRYSHADGQRATHVRYVGDDTLAGSVWRVLCAPRTEAEVHWLEPEPAHGRDRRAWAQGLRHALLERLR
jgi:1-acyl-sn-glycerol-3-phosphate acyltransferase